MARYPLTHSEIVKRKLMWCMERYDEPGQINKIWEVRVLVSFRLEFFRPFFRCYSSIAKLQRSLTLKIMYRSLYQPVLAAYVHSLLTSILLLPVLLSVVSKLMFPSILLLHFLTITRYPILKTSACANRITRTLGKRNKNKETETTFFL